MFFTTLLPFTIGLLGFKRLRATSRIIFWLVAFSFITDAYGRVLWLLKLDNLFLFHFGPPVEFFIISLAFAKALKGFVNARIILAIAVAFALASVLNTLFLQPLHTNNSNAKALESVLIMGYTIMYFFKLSKEASILRLEQDSFFWFNSGALMHYAGTLFIVLYSDHILKYSVDLGMRIWFVYAIFLLVYNICLSISLWVGRKK